MVRSLFAGNGGEITALKYPASLRVERGGHRNIKCNPEFCGMVAGLGQ